jgi:cob(I)alamin adenosyltransferase
MSIHSLKKLTMNDNIKDKDHGLTRSGARELLPKDDPVFEAVGTLDELNGHLGLIISVLDMEDNRRTLSLIQKKLSLIMSELAFAPEKESEKKNPHPVEKNTAEQNIKNPNSQTLRAGITSLEEEVEHLKKESKRITGFVQPGESKIGAYVHIARTVCRRAERRIVSMRNHYDVSDESLIYINRLSEYLFYLSCAVSKIFKKD